MGARATHREWCGIAWKHSGCQRCSSVVAARMGLLQISQFGASSWFSAKHVRCQVPSLSPGDLVTHDKFGLGTVVSTDGYGDQAEAKIDFGGEYGVKHLVLRYAPLEKL